MTRTVSFFESFRAPVQHPRDMDHAKGFAITALVMAILLTVVVVSLWLFSKAPPGVITGCSIAFGSMVAAIGIDAFILFKESKQPRSDQHDQGTQYEAPVVPQVIPQQVPFNPQEVSLLMAQGEAFGRGWAQENPQVQAMSAEFGAFFAEEEARQRALPNDQRDLAFRDS